MNFPKPKSMLASLLLEKPPEPLKGRPVRFGTSDPDINFATGPMPERVIALLQASSEPLTAKQIASGIASNSSRVAATLKVLQSSGRVEQIKIIGCTAEYALKS